MPATSTPGRSIPGSRIARDTRHPKKVAAKIMNRLRHGARRKNAVSGRIILTLKGMRNHSARQIAVPAASAAALSCNPAVCLTRSNCTSMKAATDTNISGAKAADFGSF